MNEHRHDMTMADQGLLRLTDVVFIEESSEEEKILLKTVMGHLMGADFFIATAIFLFYCNHGQTGLYDFPVMAMGFLVYRHLLECRVVGFLRTPLRWTGLVFGAVARI